MGERARGAVTVSQMSAGRKNRLSIEVYGTKGGAAWDQEKPNELWLGNRNTNNQLLVKDPSLLLPGAQAYAELPGGHAEGYGDTFKQVFKRFYGSIESLDTETQYPRFRDGLRQLTILQAALDSHKNRGWVDVPAPEEVKN
jgi:predicted dehydrogenase